jgi:hypothetical protein
VEHLPPEEREREPAISGLESPSYEQS